MVVVVVGVVFVVVAVDVVVFGVGVVFVVEAVVVVVVMLLELFLLRW